MLRFDKLVRSSMTVRDVKRQYPNTSSTFEEFGFRSVCDDCSIEVVAQRQGLMPIEIINALNTVIDSAEGAQE
jgi:hypothetical protein